MKRVKEYFSDKSAEQIFSLCLLIGVVALMLFCAIVRICGGLWFLADMSNIDKPTRFVRETVMGALLALELTFVYKILCRTKWLVCIAISVCETLIGILIGYLTRNIGKTILNLFYMGCNFVIPLFFTKKAFTLLESALLYILCLLYSLLFLCGRIGGISIATYNFYANVIGAIDYKLFIVALYLIINYFGGIKLWNKQKRVLFKTRQ